MCFLSILLPLGVGSVGKKNIYISGQHNTKNNSNLNTLFGCDHSTFGQYLNNLWYEIINKLFCKTYVKKKIYHFLLLENGSYILIQLGAKVVIMALKAFK